MNNKLVFLLLENHFQSQKVKKVFFISDSFFFFF